MKTVHDVYTQADKVDRLIMKLMQAIPVTAENWHLWALYVRTINTTMRLAERQIAEVMPEAGFDIMNCA